MSDDKTQGLRDGCRYANDGEEAGWIEVVFPGFVHDPHVAFG
jgi:hypothetical protein